MAILVLKSLADTLNKDLKKIETIITGRKFVLGVYAAIAVGVLTVVLISHESRDGIRGGTKHKLSNAAITIQVDDLKKLIIESVE